MMRGIRRLVVCTAVSGLLAAGAVTASMEVAHADSVVNTCIGAADSTPTAYDCTLTATVASPSAITVSVTDNGTTSSGATASEDITVNVTTLSCTDSSSTASEPASSATGSTPLTDNVMPLPATADGQCHVAATVGLTSTDTNANGFAPTQFTARLSYTPSSATASPGPSPTPVSGGAVHPVKGYDGKCLDDKGNSAANRAVVVIWSCSGSDQAENWKFSSNELIHNGKCLNDQGNGGSRSKVILWSCTGGSNEKWSELANGELKLKSHGGTLCLDDPGYSTKNGTQLIVYNCKASANQKWALP
jgi:hypothetical protein